MIDGDLVLSGTQAREKLELKPSTFRKYQDILESVGYMFKRDSKGYRQYTSYDIMIFEKLIEYSKHDGMTLEKSARLIMERSNNLVTHDSIIGEKQLSTNLLEELIHQNNEKQLQLYQKMVSEMEGRLSEQIKQNHMEVVSQLDQREKQTSIFIEEWREQKKLQQQLLLETTATKEKKWWQFWK